MHKLYLRYSAMKAGKTLSLLSIKTAYERQNKPVFCIKPEIDIRDGCAQIKSRMLDEPGWADLIMTPETTYREILDAAINKRGARCILVDEGQFLTPDNVNVLRMLTKCCPVIVFTLRADYTGHLFEGSKRLFEVADTIEEIKNVCFMCNKKATMNLRKNPVGPSIMLGDDEYEPACWNCWYEHMSKFYQKMTGEKTNG